MLLNDLMLLKELKNTNLVGEIFAAMFRSYSCFFVETDLFNSKHL